MEPRPAQLGQLNPAERGVRVPIERNLVVLVTGAGASRAFGANQKPLPLMGDWLEAIVGKLERATPGYLDATGLNRSMSGEQFEQYLGDFLREVAAFRQIGDLLAPSLRFPGIPNVGS